MKAEELIKNIGKKCIITESPIAGLSGKEATIIALAGSEEHGFRYEVKLDIPIEENNWSFYPPVIKCKIIEEEKPQILFKKYCG